MAQALVLHSHCTLRKESLEVECLPKIATDFSCMERTKPVAKFPGRTGRAWDGQAAESGTGFCRQKLWIMLGGCDNSIFF